MSIQAPRVRRLATVVAVVAALVVGYGSIRAAAAWTAASAPLSVAPVPVSALQERMAVEQARSEDLQAQLETLTAQSTEMTAALEAAQSQIATDTDHANALAKELKDAKKKLAKLEASIAKAKRAVQPPTIVVTKTVAAAPKHHDDDEDDDDEGEDDD